MLPARSPHEFLAPTFGGGTYCPDRVALRNKWRGLKVERPLGEARDAGEDLIGGVGPHERLSVSVVRVDEFADRHLEGAHASMHAAAQLLVRELGEPSLDEVEPRSVRGG